MLLQYGLKLRHAGNSAGKKSGTAPTRSPRCSKSVTLLSEDLIIARFPWVPGLIHDAASFREMIVSRDVILRRIEFESNVPV
jgi:hypothetical protein